MIKAKIVLHIFIKDGMCKGVVRVAGAKSSPTLSHYEGEDVPMTLQEVCASAVKDWGVDFSEIKGPVVLISSHDLLGGWEHCSSRITRRAIPIPERVLAQQPTLRALDDALAAQPRSMEKPIIMRAEGGRLLLVHPEFIIGWETLRALLYLAARNWRSAVEHQEEGSVNEGPNGREGGALC